MCAFFLLALLVYTIVVVFFETARMLLPWTITAAVLAGLAGLGVNRLMDRSFSARVASGISTFVLTITLGYVGFLLVPPTPPPPIPPRQGLEGLLEIMTEWPKPHISKDDLLEMLPIHLTIAGGIGVLFVSALVSGRPAARKGESPGPKDDPLPETSPQ